MTIFVFISMATKITSPAATQFNLTVPFGLNPRPMKLSEIKSAVMAGKTVNWKQSNYVVLKDSIDHWLIKCTNNDSYIGLTYRDGVTMNGEEADFYISEAL